jgi:tetratricopeptide (TPR) repeat protein
MLTKAVSLLNRIPERERYLVQAEYHRVYSGGWKAALAVLEDMEKKYPDDKEMLFIIGDGSYHLHDYARAVNYLERVLSEDPAHERALQHLVRTYRDIGQYQNMLKTAEQYAAVSVSEEAYHFLGNGYAWINQYHQGLEKLNKARELFPHKLGLTATIAKLYMLSGNWVSAEEELRKLIKDDKPASIQHLGYAELRNLYVFRGQYCNALETCDKEIELFWKDKDTTSVAIMHIRKAWLLVMGWNNIEGAWKKVEKTFSFQDAVLPGRYQTSLFDIYVYHGDYSQAEILLESGLLTVEPNRAFLHSVKGECNEALSYARPLIAASEPWRKLFLLYPLAKCYFESGEYIEALKYALQIENYYASFSNFQAFYYPKGLYLIARIYEEIGENKLALAYYDKLTSLWIEGDSDLPELLDAQKRALVLR